MMHFLLKTIFFLAGLSSLALVQASPTRRMNEVSEPHELRHRLVRRIYHPNFDEDYPGHPQPKPRNARMEYAVCMFKFIGNSRDSSDLAGICCSEQEQLTKVALDLQSSRHRDDHTCSDEGTDIQGL